MQIELAEEKSQSLTEAIEVSTANVRHERKSLL